MVERAERVVGDESQRRGGTEATLGERNKGDREKVQVVVQLRKETLVTVAWIAERLQMGSTANVNTLLYIRTSQNRLPELTRKKPGQVLSGRDLTTRTARPGIDRSTLHQPDALTRPLGLLSQTGWKFGHPVSTTGDPARRNHPPRVGS